MEEDQNNTRLDEIELYQKVMKAMLSKVKSSDTTAELKAKFQSIETVAANLRDLFSLENLPKEAFNKSLTEHNIGTEKKMQILVVMPMGKTFVLYVKEGDTIQSVKAMIQDLRPTPRARQTLLFGGTELQDIDTLSACNIKSGSILHMILEKKVRILISLEGEHDMHLYVRKWFTIWDVKTMIASVKHIPQQKQNLSCNGKQLIKDFVTLADCSIDDGYKLQLTYSTKVFHPIKILVTTQSNRTLMFYVHRSFGVYNLKKLIEEEIDAPADSLYLIFDGRKMDDSKTLEDYGVENGSNIDSMLIQRGS